MMDCRRKQQIWALRKIEYYIIYGPRYYHLAHEQLFYGFSWDASPEGWVYWTSVARTLHKHADYWVKTDFKFRQSK